METHTAFTLTDGSQFDTIEKAIKHCQEMMGAELREFVSETGGGDYVYRKMLKIVIDKKYDKAIFAYVKWRKELDELENYYYDQ